MKKNFLVFLVSLFLLVIGSTGANALPVALDLDGVGITGSGPSSFGDADNITDFFNQLTLAAETTVTQFDNDGNGLDVGDTFIDEGSILFNGVLPGGLDDEGLESFWEFTAEFRDLTGYVTDVAVDAGITRVDYLYTGGFVDLYVQAGPVNANFGGDGVADDTGFADGTPVGIFELTAGIGHTFLDLVSFSALGNQGSGDFSFKAVSLIDDFWFDAQGDLAERYNDVINPIEWFIALTDYNVDNPNIINIGGSGDTDPLFTADVEHNGSIQFSTVPEPTTMLLFGMGLLGMARLGRKKDRC
jgi:hypothetical protein